KKIVSLEVTSEEIHDGSRLKNLVDNALENNTLKIVIADGAYDIKENFRYLYDNNIEAAIKVRKNSSYRNSSYPPRLELPTIREESCGFEGYDPTSLMTETAKLRKLVTKRGTLEILIPLCCTTDPVRYMKFRQTLKVTVLD
ncbi:MAG: transposase, partial [Candidatus Nitrosopolaris sp.]